MRFKKLENRNCFGTMGSEVQNLVSAFLHNITKSRFLVLAKTVQHGLYASLHMQTSERRKSMKNVVLTSSRYAMTSSVGVECRPLLFGFGARHASTNLTANSLSSYSSFSLGVENTWACVPTS